jgi:hypothetical protein
MLQLDLRTYTGTHLARQPLRGAHATHQRPLGRAPPPAALALAPVLRQGCGSAAIVAGHRLGWLRVARLLIAALLLRFPAALAAVLLRLRLWRRLRSAHHQEGGDGRVLPSVWLLWPKLSCWVARQVSPNLSGGNLVKSQQVSPLSWPCLGPAAVGRPLRLKAGRRRGAGLQCCCGLLLLITCKTSNAAEPIWIWHGIPTAPRLPR